MEAGKEGIFLLLMMIPGKMLVVGEEEKKRGIEWEGERKWDGISLLTLCSNGMQNMSGFTYTGSGSIVPYSLL